MNNDLLEFALSANQKRTRLNAASSLITQQEYRNFVTRKANGHSADRSLNITFEGDVRELLNRAALSSSASGFVSTDQRGPLGGGPGRNIYLQDLLVQGSTKSHAVIYAREAAGSTNSTGEVGEGSDLPEQNLSLDEVTAQVGTVGGYIRVAEDTFADYLNLESFIEGQLIRRTKLSLERSVISGAGVSPNRILGFTEAGLPTVSVATAGSMLEAVQEAIAAIESNGYFPSFIALNPTDKRALYSSSVASPLLVWDGEILRLLGVPVIGTPAVAAGTGVVGDGSQAAIMYHSGIAGSASFQKSSSRFNDDDFIMNLITVKAWVRAALVIQSLDAFVEIVA